MPVSYSRVSQAQREKYYEGFTPFAGRPPFFHHLQDSVSDEFLNSSRRDYVGHSQAGCRATLPWTGNFTAIGEGCSRAAPRFPLGS